KLVTAPTATCSGVGNRASIAGSGSPRPPVSPAVTAIVRPQRPTNIAVRAPRAVSNAVIGFMRLRSPGVVAGLESSWTALAYLKYWRLADHAQRCPILRLRGVGAAERGGDQFHERHADVVEGDRLHVAGVQVAIGAAGPRGDVDPDDRV